MKAKAKKIYESDRVKRMVENIIRCKWSLSVIDQISRGTTRTGAIERSIEGLTTKVLNERLRKLVRFGILEKTIYAETPPRVEYHLTEFGRKFTHVLDAIEKLEKELDT